MKKILSILCVALLFTTSFSAIAKTEITISLSKRADDRDVRNFNGVAAGGPINVVITLGNTESCRLEGDAEALETLITEVKGNVLIIRPQNSWKSWEKKYENKKITAYVTAKSIKSLTMSGSGSMVVNGAVNSKDLSATLSGSGSIKATADVDNFTGVISGSGNLTIAGKADDASITLSGSGTFAGRGFSVNDLSTQVSGSGTVNIKADRKIDAVISGSGNVNYSGNASVDKTVVGSGKVRKI
ncbi:head GIN domain-containing protein [Pedobacter aquatilis]|uniref:head GIN domain-containing protein n=1 Tax=Pedobacter aquatilis TaxID=351343 RepID=UPI00292D08A4|nr:head GIN domain-containing protein [Pedobacter aquatilis]